MLELGDRDPELIKKPNDLLRTRFRSNCLRAEWNPVRSRHLYFKDLSVSSCFLN